MGRQGPATFSKTLPAGESEESRPAGTIHTHQCNPLRRLIASGAISVGATLPVMNDPSERNRRACPWRSPSSKFSYGYHYLLSRQFAPTLHPAHTSKTGGPFAAGGLITLRITSSGNESCCPAKQKTSIARFKLFNRGLSSIGCNKLFSGKMLHSRFFK